MAENMQRHTTRPGDREWDESNRPGAEESYSQSFNQGPYNETESGNSGKNQGRSRYSPGESHSSYQENYGQGNSGFSQNRNGENQERNYGAQRGQTYGSPWRVNEWRVNPQSQPYQQGYEPYTSEQQTGRGYENRQQYAGYQPQYQGNQYEAGGYRQGNPQQEHSYGYQQGNMQQNPGNMGRTGSQSGEWSTERQSNVQPGRIGTQWQAGAQYGTNEAQQGPHRGKGPKGYHRSDERIKEDINDRLTDDPQLDASQIEVNVANAEVKLTGTVENREAKRRAEDLADAISGVSNVENSLRVKQDSTRNYGNESSSAMGTSKSSLTSSGHDGNQSSNDRNKRTMAA